MEDYWKGKWKMFNVHWFPGFPGNNTHAQNNVDQAIFRPGNKARISRTVLPFAPPPITPRAAGRARESIWTWLHNSHNNDPCSKNISIFAVISRFFIAGSHEITGLRWFFSWASCTLPNTIFQSNTVSCSANLLLPSMCSDTAHFLSTFTTVQCHSMIEQQGWRIWRSKKQTTFTYLYYHYSVYCPRVIHIHIYGHPQNMAAGVDIHGMQSMVFPAMWAQERNTCPKSVVQMSVDT